MQENDEYNDGTTIILKFNLVMSEEKYVQIRERVEAMAFKVLCTKKIGYIWSRLYLLRGRGK